MKHSNWILGIGVIVAIILIAGSIFLSTETSGNTAIPVVNSPSATDIKPTKKIIMATFKEVSQRVLQLVE